MSDKHTLIKGEAITSMRKMNPHSVDMILTDPPYFMPATHYMTSADIPRTFADMGIFEHFFADFYREAHRVLAPDGVIYMFCNSESYPIFYWHAFIVFGKARCVVWEKNTASRARHAMAPMP